PPRDKKGLEFSASYGSNAFRRFFLRADSGLIKDLNFKAFASFSTTQADKWRGPGMHPAYRDHFTLGLAHNLGRLRYEFYFNNNAQLNYFYRGLTYAQISDLSANRKLDYTPTLIRSGDGLSYAPNEPAFENNRLYYKFYQNPYDNQEYRANIDIDITKDISLNLKPYAWVGRGSGTSAVTTTSGGRSFIFFRESFNYTDRPGIITELSYNLPNGKLYVGYWYERSDLKQWQPQRPIRVLPDGSFEALAPTTGTPAFQYNYIQRTFTTTNIPYLFAEFDDVFGLKLNFGLRYANVKRDFKNYRTANLPYLPDDAIYDQVLTLDPRLSYKKTYTKLLPSAGISYELNKNTQIYLAYAKNFRVPTNFLGTIPANVNAQFVADQLKPEESDSFDIGARLDFDKYYITPSIYLVEYKDRIISTVDPNDPNLIYQRNAGKVSANGAELEFGAKPFDYLSLYGSLSYNSAKFKDENFFDGNVRVSIKDKDLPDTPKLMFKLGAHLKLYDFDIKPSVQYLSKRYGNFTNTESVSSYTIVDMRVEREFYNRRYSAFLDIKNLFDKKYVGRISAGARSGTYYPGTPLSVAVGLRGRF
ncbi:MAG: TonB-dependent receptor, partial [Aquificaceae bacterium]|nr:TonB-dependent receptor [Aquificaceae bacterium]MDW8237866.1 TonB-dependent receptor [Aquificaceae bacterium]